VGLNYKRKNLKYQKKLSGYEISFQTCRSRSIGNTSQQAIYHPEFETREMNLGLKKNSE
jgi:hypothetical protein